nr:dihydrofolate reductase family protein [uncultured Actinoplanes sp.]
MRKLVESTFVTIDGVISSPQDWGAPYWDDEHAAYAHQLLFAADALVLGRVTYEGFAQAWPARAGADEYADRINAMPKHVATTTLTDLTWNASRIEGDVVAGIAELKQQPGGDLLKFGTGPLDRTLIEHGLLDELHLWVFPAVAGHGDRLLDGIGTTHFALERQTRFDSGIVVLVYRPK